MPLPQEPPPLVEVSQVVTTLKAGAWDKQIQELSKAPSLYGTTPPKHKNCSPPTLIFP